MKFICERSVLLKEISVAHEIISSKNVLSILSNILIEARDNSLTIKATDLKVNYETVIPVQVEEPGNTTVYCEKFLNILRSLPEENINFEHQNDNLHITNDNNSIDFKLNTINPDKFPEIQENTEESFFEFSQKDFLEMIAQTIFSVSDDESRYFMNGVSFEKSESNIIMVATDGKRLSFISKNIENEIPDFSSIIIPPKVLNMVKKLASGEGNLFISVTDKTIYIKFDNQKLSSTLIEGQFPNYNRVIPENQEHKLVLDRNTFISALRRVSILAEQRSKRIYMNMSEGKLNLTSEETEVGIAKESIDCDYQGDEVTFALNHTYLTDPLKEIGEDNISIQFTEAGKAITVTSDPESDYFHIIMPMHME